MPMPGALRCVALALVVLGVGACRHEEGSSLEAADLRGVVLQPGDLSREFEQFDEGRLRASEQPEGRDSDPARFGRVEGWKARYRRAGAAGEKGLFVIESRADLFAGDGAADELQSLRPLSQRAGRTELEAPAVGNEAFAWSAVQPGAEHDVVTLGVVWRRDEVVSAVSGTGFSGGVGIEDVVRLARKQDARIVRLAAGS